MRKQTKESEPVKIEKFIQSVLALAGLQRGKDYTIRPHQLRINKNPLRGKLLEVLKEYYPEYSYYWETPKILRWF